MPHESSALPASLKFENSSPAKSSDYCFATLVVCLPCPFVGGNLTVSHNRCDVEYPWSQQRGQAIQWTAFYNNCRYLPPKVTGGYCVSLTYNISATLEGDQPNPTVNPEYMPVYDVLKELLKSESFMKLGNHRTCIR